MIHEKLNAVLIDEFTRIGGGQVLANLFLDYLQNEKYKTYVVTDSEHPFLDYGSGNIVETPYVYRENISWISLLFTMLKTRKFLNRMQILKDSDLVFNNHPNMFLYRGDVNVLHGFSFLDPVIDEKGTIQNKLLYEMIKNSGIYKIYGNANFYVNSKYTMELSRSLFPKLGVEPKAMKVVYIPVIKPDLSYPVKRDDRLIVSIGRLNKDKQYEDLLKIASELPNYRFLIIGALNKGDEEYIKSLTRNMGTNVSVMQNLDNIKKENILRKASIYLHLKRKEHYGISVVEAMSYGLIPVVPKSGGPWIDIVEKGKYGYGFDSVQEGVEMIKNVDMSRSKEIYESVDRFSYQNFHDGLSSLIEIVKNS